ncbi:TorF family putative porin [Massilia sp. IC2-278]|uniref:TorF family putative porin n=1 Tax=Massilia sp. IC2-278 TaxID=2887200 RepID=UPI001E53D11E|nr:TorF family putative porin [Massilia sp. IC2-278]MCC2959550.1 TorF family putative porin [Massilia sp. IC2-278]
MKIILLAAALSTVMAGLVGAARAADSPDFTLSANAALTSDYRYRGISQTRLQPAIQLGADYAAASGWYAGAWASSITWTRDAGGSGSIEADVYGGRRGELGGGVSYDAGLLGYVYPSNGLSRVSGFDNANSAEAYAQLGYGVATLKYSHSLTNLFGIPDSHGSGYLDLNLNLAAGDKTTINLHAGRQRVRHVSASSYTDWKAAVVHDFGIASVTLAAVGTNAGRSAYASPADGRFLGKRAVVLSIGRTF